MARAPKGSSKPAPSAGTPPPGEGVVREPAEVKFARELTALAEADPGPRPPG